MSLNDDAGQTRVARREWAIQMLELEIRVANEKLSRVTGPGSGAYDFTYRGEVFQNYDV